MTYIDENTRLSIHKFILLKCSRKYVTGHVSEMKMLSVSAFIAFDVDRNLVVSFSVNAKAALPYRLVF